MCRCEVLSVNNDILIDIAASDVNLRTISVEHGQAMSSYILSDDVELGDDVILGFD